MGKELLALVLDSIDLEKLVVGVLHLAEKEAQAAAAKTATVLDDSIEAIAFPAINPALEALIKKEVADLKAKLAQP